MVNASLLPEKELSPQANSAQVLKKKLYENTQEHSFVLSDGRKLNSVFALVDELESMNEETFKTHVNANKNDFANWVRDVFGEKMLAQELKSTPTKIEMQRTLLKQIARDAKGMIERE